MSTLISWMVNFKTNCLPWLGSMFKLIFSYFIHNCYAIVSWHLLTRSCNKVGHLFWFTILAQHETNEVIPYIHSIHKHRGNSFQRQSYKMRLKQRSLNWINSMQVKKILFTNVFYSWSICLLNMFPSWYSPQSLLPFCFVDIIVITVHDRFWNVGQANCILKYFENMMIDHSDSTIF
jgi:hypothetical protein